jgi:hypothetical protein
MLTLFGLIIYLFKNIKSHSLGSAPSSIGSSSSKRFSRRYRTVNMRSEVDENLFGAPNRLKQAQSIRDNKSSKYFDILKLNLFSFYLIL